MRTLLKTIIGASLTLLSLSAMAGIVTLHRHIKNFNQIDLHSSGQVYIQQGNQDSIVVKVPQRVAKYMDIYKTRKTLHLTIDNHPFHIRRQPVYYITMRHIRGLIDRNSGLMQMNTPIRSNQLNIVLHKGGQINLGRVSVNNGTTIQLNNSGQIQIKNLQTQSAQLTLTNSGLINIDQLEAGAISSYLRNSGTINIHNGRVKSEYVTVRNSGHYQAGNLIARHADVTMHNSGHVVIRVNGTLAITKRGSGDLTVYGHPRMTRYDVRNSSSIHMR